jgi:SNF2 family DNA or RNA helicase
MNEIESSWVLVNNAISIQKGREFYSVSSADIVRSEFKGLKNIDSVGNVVRPSEQISGIRINRFPCELKLRLILPISPLQKPELKLAATAMGQESPLSEFPLTDQIIVEDSEWYSLSSDNQGDIETILSRAQIVSFGPISLAQAMDLMALNSPLISIHSSNESSIQESDSTPDIAAEIQTLQKCGFTANLYEYQKTGFAWLRSVSEEGLGCILADEMGLGKTLQIIALLTFYKKSWKQASLIIAPATLLENWRREFQKFSPKMSVYVHSGNHRTGFPSEVKSYDVTVCSYETAVRDQSLLKMIDWGFIILDEAQAIKNPEAQRSRAIKSISTRVAVSVTGTPVENSLIDLWSIMNFSCPKLLGPRISFEKEFVNDLQSAQKLETIVSPLMLRRRIADVAQDLPEKIVIPQIINLSDSEIDAYESIRQETIAQFGQTGGLVTLLRLRQYCTHPLLIREHATSTPVNLVSCSKYRRLIEIIDEIKQNTEKVIVFTSFTKMSDLLCSDLPQRLKIPTWNIDGRTEVKERQSIVDTFSQAEGPAALVLNPRAAGTGLNITAANHVIHYTLEWNPALEDQSTARAFRRGQSRPVIVHRLFYADTVEEAINERLERKRLIASAAVVGTEANEIDARDIAKALLLSPSTKAID